eukprot:1187662-Amphidinium_carterae.1
MVLSATIVVKALTSSYLHFTSMIVTPPDQLVAGNLSCPLQSIVDVAGVGIGLSAPHSNNALQRVSIQAIKRFIIENGLQTTILQSNGQPSIIELLNEVTRQMPHLRSQ